MVMAQNEGGKSTKQSDAPQRLTSRMQAYSNFREEQVPEYLAGFKRMVAEFGEKRTNEGLTMAIDNTPDYPPTPARIRSHIPREQAQRATCPRCADSHGFIQVDKYTVKLCDHTEAA